MVVGTNLFVYTVNENFGVAEIENMFLQMMAFTGQKHFDAEQLSVCPLADVYFRSDGKDTLKHALILCRSRLLTLMR